MHEWIQHNGCHLDRFVLGKNHYSYDWYDITHWNFVCIFRHQFSCCFFTSHWPANTNRTFWPSYSLIYIVQHLDGVFDPCTCTGELSCVTIWSLQSSKSWQVAKLVHTFLFTEIWCQKYQFASLFLRGLRTRHYVFVLIRFLYGD